MKPVPWMIGAGLVTWLAATVGFGAQTVTATLSGVAGPLLVTVATWLLAARTYRRDPQALTGLMTAGFAGKMVFFGAYVALAIKGLSQPVVPFVVSFAGSFIALHLIEALALRRLFAS
jgi:F0F1-type ATP synthase assembly protein I